MCLANEESSDLKGVKERSECQLIPSILLAHKSLQLHHVTSSTKHMPGACAAQVGKGLTDLARFSFSLISMTIEMLNRASSVKAFFEG